MPMNPHAVPITRGHIAKRDHKSLLGDWTPICPHCGKRLEDGSVLASWRNGKLVALTHTVRIGLHFYEWHHRADGCRVPALDRLLPVRQA